MRTSKFVGNSYIPGHFLSPGSYTSGHVARIQLYTCHHLEHPWLGRHFLLFRVLAKLLTHDTTQCIVALERDLFWVASSGAFVHTFPVVSPAAFMIYFTCFIVYVQVSCPLTSSSGQLGSDYLPSSSAMSLFRWSLITWSPRFRSGDFIFNPVTAGLGMLEIGACQLNNWRLHEPPDFLPFCQPGVPFNTPI